MTATMTPERSGREPQAGRDSFGRLLHAEWTKFRTVRGWVIAMVAGAALTAGVGLWAAAGGQSGCQPVGPNGPIGPPGVCHPVVPLGPGGQAVSDSFYFVHQTLPGNGSITVRVTSLTGRYSPNGGIAPGPDPEKNFVSGVAQPWSKAGHPRDREHPAGVCVRGHDGHRRARRADAVQLHTGHARPAGCRLSRLAPVAAAGPVR